MVSVALIVLVGIGFVCSMVILPLLLELCLNLLEVLGFRPWRSLHITRLMSSAMRLSDKAEYLVMVSVLALITMPIYIHFSHVVPFFIRDYPEDSWLPLPVYLCLVHIIPSIFLNSNMFYHFYKIVFVSPGLTKNIVDSSLAVSDRGSERWCSECQLPKPPEAHHCHTCGGCVIRHDHHCIFAANCIGLKNSHHFFLFILYCALSCLYAVYVSYEPYSYCNSLPQLKDGEEPAPGSLKERCRDYGGSDVFFWLAIFSSVVLCLFFIIIFHVTVSGDTLHDFLKQRVWKRHQKTKSDQDGAGPDSTVVTIKARKRPERKREKELQGWKENIESSLGPLRSWWRWLIPVPWLHKKSE